MPKFSFTYPYVQIWNLDYEVRLHEKQLPSYTTPTPKSELFFLVKIYFVLNVKFYLALGNSNLVQTKSNRCRWNKIAFGKHLWNELLPSIGTIMFRCSVLSITKPSHITIWNDIINNRICSFDGLILRIYYNSLSN